MQEKITTIAIDPSINETGAAVIENGKLIDFATVKAPAKNKLSVRLNLIAQGVKEFVAPYIGANCNGIIEVADKHEYMNTKGFGGPKRNNQGALHKLQLATGAIIRACGECGLMLDDVTPFRWKGRTPKDIIINSVNLKHGLKFALSAKGRTGRRIESSDSHMAEAIALAEWHGKKLKIERMMKK